MVSVTLASANAGLTLASRGFQPGTHQSKPPVAGGGPVKTTAAMSHLMVLTCSEGYSAGRFVAVWASQQRIRKTKMATSLVILSYGTMVWSLTRAALCRGMHVIRRACCDTSGSKSLLDCGRAEPRGAVLIPCAQKGGEKRGQEGEAAGGDGERR